MNDRPTLPERLSPPDDSVIGRLFHRWPKFESPKDWRKAGFHLLRVLSNRPDKILVVGHELTPRFLFKKYGSSDRQSPRAQLEKYQNRVAGASLLRSHIVKNGLRHVVVPQKWICALPAEPGSKGQSTHVLVVERHKIRDADESAQCYRRIGAEAACELCTILFAFRGLDFKARNAPFTRDGKISFIDTEHTAQVQLSRKKLDHHNNRYQKAVDLMLSKHLRLAEDVWKELVKTADLK